MTNQAPTTNVTNIILLFKDFQYFNNQLADDVIALYQKEGAIIEAIHLQDPYDYHALEQLIIKTKLNKDYHVNVMFDVELSNTPYYTLLWSTLGVLLVSDLITITTYGNSYKKIIFEKISGPSNQHLAMASYFLKHYYMYSDNKKDI